MTATTYNPVALQLGYRPAGAALPMALCWLLVVTPPAAAAPVPGVGAHPRSAYVPLAARLGVQVPAEEAFDETVLAAMPVRGYRVKGVVRNLKQGELRF